MIPLRCLHMAEMESILQPENFIVNSSLFLNLEETMLS